MAWSHWRTLLHLWMGKGRRRQGSRPRLEALEDRLTPASDFGDAPLPYPTLLSEGGAEHVALGPTLGATRDSEADGTHSPGNADDLAGTGDDEDGVTFGTIRTGALGATVTVNVQNASGGARLDAWIDFNRDGNWGGPSEQIAHNVAVVNGDNILPVDVPSWAAAGTTFARFRLSTAGNLGPSGVAADGEVEDHAVTLLPPFATPNLFTGSRPVSSSVDGATSVQAADLDGDGDMDVIAPATFGNRISWFANDGQQNFTEHVVASVDTFGPRSVTTVDIDGDGDLDLVAAVRGSAKVAWYENDGSQNFTEHAISVFSVSPYSVQVGDVDGDGDIDLLVTAPDQDKVVWYANDGQQNFTERDVTTGADRPTSGVLADVDGDGDLDVIVASTDDDTIAWYENDGQQNFTQHVVTATAEFAVTVAAADLDGDGDPDILAASSGDRTVAWYENDGSGSFSRRVLSSDVNGPVAVQAADLDGDGDLDVLTGGGGLLPGNAILRFENNGDRTFTQHVLATENFDVHALYAADLDGDGDLDPIVGSAFDDRIVWYESRGFDFGDAPSPYPTTRADNGARHAPVGPRLGPNRDEEDDGQPGAAADGDDTSGSPDDEDGVSFVSTTLTASPGRSNTAQVQINLQTADGGSNRLDAWIDGNRNGSWDDAGEQVLASFNLGTSNGVQAVSFTIPRVAGGNFVAGSTVARFRLSTAGGLAPTGAAANGEVEDHVVTLAIDATPPSLTAFTRQGLVNIPGQGDTLVFRATFDGDVEGVSADDFTVAGGSTATVSGVTPLSERVYEVRVSGGDLAVFVGSVGLNLSGSQNITDPVGNALPSGEPATDEVFTLGARDFGDAPAPYPTIGTENGARHLTVGPTLGARRDADADGTHSTGADADDAAGTPDDEDGVTFGRLQVGALRATVTVNVQNAPAGARLDAWIDFNRDGNWGGPNEQLARSVPVVNGDNVLTFDVPSDAVQGTTFARFRLSTAGNLGPAGLALDGEVEDHSVVLLPPTAVPGTFGGQNVFPSSVSGAFTVFAADLDGDGDLDVLSGASGGDSIAWYENDGRESFTPHVISSTARVVISVSAVDLDGDGDLDVLATSHLPDQVTWYENDGLQSFTPHVVGDPGNGPITAIAADVDGDGDLDVLAGSVFSDPLTWYENDGRQNFTRHVITQMIRGPLSIEPVDLDSDGDLDILVPSSGDGRIVWYENDGRQGFAEREAVVNVYDARSVQAVDIDGDGDLDIVSASAGDNTVAWHENDGLQNFTEHVLSTTAYGAVSVFVADIDGDGDLDVLAASEYDSRIVGFVNDGRQTFSERPITTAASRPFKVLAADVDGDGDLDVLSASVDDNKIAWYENQGPERPAAATSNPVAVARQFVTLDNRALRVTPRQGLLAFAARGDRQRLTVQLVRGPQVGTLKLNRNGSFLYVPRRWFQGAVTFTYRIFDGRAFSEPAPVTIHVYPSLRFVLGMSVFGQKKPRAVH